MGKKYRIICINDLMYRAQVKYRIFPFWIRLGIDRISIDRAHEDILIHKKETEKKPSKIIWAENEYQ